MDKARIETLVSYLELEGGKGEMGERERRKARGGKGGGKWEIVRKVRGEGEGRRGREKWEEGRRGGG